MRANTRLGWSMVAIIVSAAYAVVIAQDPELANALMIGYVLGLLTIFFICEVFKKK